MGDAENIENRSTERFDGLKRGGSSKQGWFLLEGL